MTDTAEREDVGTKGKRGSAAITPVDDDRVCVERSWVAEAAAETRGVVGVDGRLAQIQLDVRRRDVVDIDGRSGARAGAGVVCNGDGDGIAAGGRRIEILMAGAAEGQHAGAQV